MAKILGQLERAQYENVVGNPVTALAVGRFWADITSPTAAIPKFYNGSATFQFGLHTTNPIGNSGSGAITINWALGITQTLTLTGNVVITHSNMPTNGQVCTLIITQAIAVPLFQVLFTPDNYWQKQTLPQLIPVNGARKYTFVSTAAFLPAITVLGAYNSTLVGALTGMSAAAVSNDGNWVAFSQGAAAVYISNIAQGPVNGLNFGPPGSPASAVGTINCIAWHPSGNFIAVGSQTTPFIQIFPVSFGNFSSGQAVAAPASNPPAAVTGLAWSPAGDALVFTSGTTPFIGGYPFTNGVFGTKYGNPGTLPTAATACKFHPSGAFVAIGLNAAPGIAAYVFSSSTGFGAKSTNPVPATFLASQTPDALVFSPDGLFVGFGCTATPFIHIWPFSTGGAFGTVVANPATLPASQVFGMGFSAYNDYVYATTQTGSTVLYAYPWAAAYGALGTNALVLPPTTGLIAPLLHPTGEFVGWYGTTTPFMGYYSAPRSIKNYVADQY